MAQVNVSISGKLYRMACDDGQEDHLNQLAARLDETIEQLRQQFGEIGDQRLTVMAAITMADQNSEAERRLSALEGKVAHMEEARAAVVEQQQAQESAFAHSIEAFAERVEALAGRLTDNSHHRNGG
jgi:cell division protein ZapA